MSPKRPARVWVYLGVVTTVILAVVAIWAMRWTSDPSAPTPPAAPRTQPGDPSGTAQPGVGQVVDYFTMGRDARSLTLHFTGIPDTKGPCGADYRAEVFESANAVVVSLVAQPHEGSGTVACPAVAQLRTATVTIDAPLAGRAVVNLTGGQPVPQGVPRG